MRITRLFFAFYTLFASTNAFAVPYPAQSDDDLTAAADEVFLDLDRREAGA